MSDLLENAADDLVAALKDGRVTAYREGAAIPAAYWRDHDIWDEPDLAFDPQQLMSVFPPMARH